MKGYGEEATGFKGSNKGDANNNGCNSNGGNNNGGRQWQWLGGAAMAAQGVVGGRGRRPSITGDFEGRRRSRRRRERRWERSGAIMMITMMVVDLEGADKMRAIILKDKRTSTTMLDECNESKGFEG
jgi:hypothetical protein